MKRTMFCMAAALACAAAPAFAADDCAPVRAAYKAGGKKHLHMEISGKVTVRDMSAIHAGKVADTCKLLRSEKFEGQDAFVYLEHVAGVGGTSDETIWIAKSNGFMLHQDVKTSIQGKGKGHIKVDIETDPK